MHTILVVEDNADIRNMVTILLQLDGYHVIPTAHGAEGLDCLHQHPIDLILSDLRMPRLDGAELYQIIRTDLRYQTLPFILISGTSPPQGITTDLHSSFLTKPLDPPALLATIAHLIEHHHHSSKERSR